MARCNYGPACSFTAVLIQHDRDAELCPATQPTARRALKLTAGSPRHTAILHRPTTKDHAPLPYHLPATFILLPHHLTPDDCSIQSP